MMNDHTVACPSCRHVFPLDLAFREGIRVEVTSELTKTYDLRLTQQREQLSRELTQATETRLAASHAEQVTGLESKLAERDGALRSARQQLGDARKQAGEQARAEFALAQTSMQAELERQNVVVRDLRVQEINLRREKQQLEDTQHRLEVEHHRGLDEARRLLKVELAAAAAEETRARELENQRQQNALRQQVDELQHRLVQSNAINQGEVLEMRLEEILRQAYPHDLLESVPRGVNGGDLRQVVTTPTGHRCGTILWETKKTRQWEAKWPAKMKADQCAARAEVAVIVTQTLPKDVRVFGQIEGIWVVHTSAVVGFSLLARCGLLELNQQRHSIQGREEKATRLVDYVCGHEQRQHFESILTSFLLQHEELQREQRALRVIWSKRQKQIDRGILALSRMYGDLQGIIGTSALPTIPGLELTPALAAA